MAMLGSTCSICCGKCGCKKGKLPYTMTVTLNGLKNKTHGNYCDLTISSCYGGGASGVATSPGGCDGDEDPECGSLATDGNGGCKTTKTYLASSRGPLTGVLLTEGGSGYAKIGRVAPTLTASAPHGKDATLTVSLDKFVDCGDCKSDWWSINSISVTGGTGYEDRSPVTIAAAAGDKTVSQAAATLRASRLEPTITAEPVGGKDGKLAVTGGVVGWGVDSISVQNPGAGYSYGFGVTLSAVDGSQKVVEAAATIKTTLAEPTLSFTASGGAGASLKESLRMYTYPDGKPYWSVVSLKIVEAGVDFEVGDKVTVSVTDGAQDAGSSFSATVATVNNGGIGSISICDGGKFHRDTGTIASVFVAEPGEYLKENDSEAPSQPTLTATVDGGDGNAKLDVSLTDRAWGIASLSVDSGGGGYKYGGQVKVDAGEAVTLEASSASLVTKLVQPTIALSACKRTGVGGVLTPTLTEATGPTGKKYWYVQSVAVTKAGENYRVGDEVFAKVTSGQAEPESSFSASVEKVKQDNGEIESVAVSSGGKYFLDTGIIESVSLENRGRYYKRGVPSEVIVSEGGKYYREDASATAYVSDITITPCGGGKNATISATVDSSPSSPTFGTITGLKITNGGTDYLAWQWIDTCRTMLNGKPYVLKATEPEPLISLSIESCFGKGATASVVPLGSREAPDICVTGSGVGGTITPTLATANESGNKYLPYWSIGSVSASGGYGYTDDESASITYGGATVTENADVTLHATGVTEEDPPDAKNDGVLTGATVNAGGKFFIQNDYDGTAGPIKLVKVTSGGSGYAMFGREEPYIELKPQSDSPIVDATFTPTLEKQQDACGIHYWQIKSVSVSGGSCFGMVGRTAPTLETKLVGGQGAAVTLELSESKNKCGGAVWGVKSITAKGGYGYTDKSAVTVTPTEKTVEMTAMEATLTTKKAEPTLSAKIGRISLTPAYTQTKEAWEVGSLSIPTLAPCSSFRFGQPVAFKLGGGDVQVKAAAAHAVTVVDAPRIKATASGGAGAELGVSLTSKSDDYYGTLWSIGSISVTKGGSGYSVGNPVTLTFLRGQATPDSAFKASVASVSSGSIGSITVSDGGKFFWDTRKLESIKVSEGGEYYKDGVPDSITISKGGEYFTPGPDESLRVLPSKSTTQQEAAQVTVRANNDGTPSEAIVVKGGKFYIENESLPPYVAAVSVSLAQISPSNGSGAEFDAAVDIDPKSETFGQITKISVKQNGSGYQILGAPLDCEYSGPCGIGLQFRGAGSPAEVTIGDAVFRTDTNLEDCTKLPTKASVLHSIGEGSATIAAGGVWEGGVRCPCDGDCTPSEECDGTETGTGCVTATPCPQCIGDCDNCNKCKPGCMCEGNECKPCSGACDEETPCPEGCGCYSGNCQPCCGPCDDANPCPAGCACVNGQCSYVSCTSEKTVTFGGSTILFYTNGSCSGDPNFNWDIQGQTGMGRQWAENIAGWLEANGYSDVSSGATAPTEPNCTACAGPNGDCDIYGAAIFGAGGCCTDGVFPDYFDPENGAVDPVTGMPTGKWLMSEFDDAVFPGAFYIDSTSISVGGQGGAIPPCIPNELP